MERRGAEVMAIDNWDNPLFREIHARLGSRVDYRQMDMYDLTPERIGRFDIVLFMGVLYHLKHPLLALERVCALTTEMAAVDSFVLREEHRKGDNVSNRPIMEFYESKRIRRADRQLGWSEPAVSAGILPDGRIRPRGTAEPDRAWRVRSLLPGLGAGGQQGSAATDQRHA